MYRRSQEVNGEVAVEEDLHEEVDHNEEDLIVEEAEAVIMAELEEEVG